MVGAFDESSFALAYAGPAVRKLARELGVDLGKVKGTGNHGRILREDVEAFAKGGAAPAKPQAAAASGGGVGGIDLLPWPKVDFAKFGPVERKELSASRRSPRPTCTATGSSSRTSRRTTRPTSPTSSSSACR